MQTWCRLINRHAKCELITTAADRFFLSDVETFMYRTALVALHPERSNDTLLNFALDLARRHALRLEGIAILDRDRAAPREPIPIGGSAFKVMRDEAVTARTRDGIRSVLAEFTARCHQAGIVHDAIASEDGLACEIAHAVQKCDVLLIGHAAGVEGGEHPSEPSPLNDILKHCPRPAIVVPSVAPPSGSIVVAYDGSSQAARALQAFIASGFLRDAVVQVVSFDRDERIAQGWAEMATEFLRRHGYRAFQGAARSEAAVGESILAAAQRHSAQLLVMGALGKPTVREFFFGSVTRHILQAAAIPVFLDH